MSTPDRVRITSSRRGAPRRRERPVASELSEQTRLGDVYLRGLMRAQLRLGLTVVGVGAVLLGGLPLFFMVFPATASMSVAGIPLPWLVLGLGVYPSALVAARFYVRASERIERQFDEMAARR